MAGVGIRVSSNEPEIRAALAALAAAARGEGMKPAMKEIGQSLVTSTQKRFETGRGPEGDTWEESARARLQGGKTLVDQGHLKNFLTYRAHRDSVEVGSNQVYAAIHQLGGDAGRGHAVHLPARPYLGIDAADRAEILAIINDHLRAAIR